MAAFIDPAPHACWIAGNFFGRGRGRCLCPHFFQGFSHPFGEDFVYFGGRRRVPAPCFEDLPVFFVELPGRFQEGAVRDFVHFGRRWQSRRILGRCGGGCHRVSPFFRSFSFASRSIS